MTPVMSSPSSLSTVVSEEATWESHYYYTPWGLPPDSTKVTTVISASFTSGGAAETALSARERWLQRMAKRRASEPGPQPGDKQRDHEMGVLAEAIAEGRFEVSRPE